MYTIGNFLYLLLSLYFAVPWVAFYLLRKDVRTEMLVMSAAGALLAPLADTIILKDWWHPMTLTQGPVHFESLLFGFFSIGVASVAAQVMGGHATRAVKGVYRPKWYHMVAGVGAALGLMFGPNLMFGVCSAYTTLLASGFLALCVGVRRPDLLAGMGFSAVMAALVAIPGYWLILGNLAPHWFADAWYLNNLSGHWVAGLPLEEVLWYVGTGAAFGTAYKCLMRIGFVERGEEAVRVKVADL